MKPNIGILHPGSMGVTIAIAARDAGCAVHWASENRRAQSRDRARDARLIDAETVANLCQQCPIILSVCPPHAAEDVADTVLQTGYRGIYVDANAIAPRRAREMAARMEAAGVSFVDGSIVGGTGAIKPKSTWLFLSGPRAEEVAASFSGSPLEVRVLGADPGMASGLKMCTAAKVKGTAALFAAVMALSESLGVREQFVEIWASKDPEFHNQVANNMKFTALRAWRFKGEMDEISETFETAGLPREFHLAAREIYDRLSGFKDLPEAPPTENFLNAILKNS